MDLIRRETRFVTGVSQELGGSGDPSAATAYGVLWAMKAVARPAVGPDRRSTAATWPSPGWARWAPTWSATWWRSGPG